MKEIRIHSETIKLDQLLKFAGIAQTGGQSKLMIKEGLVLLNGETVLERGRR